MLEKALLRAVVRCAGQTGKIDQDRQFLVGCLVCLRREVQVEGHFAVGGLGGMAKLEKLAAERGNGCFRCDGHFGDRIQRPGIRWKMLKLLL